VTGTPVPADERIRTALAAARSIFGRLDGSFSTSPASATPSRNVPLGGLFDEMDATLARNICLLLVVCHLLNTRRNSGAPLLNPFSTFRMASRLHCYLPSVFDK